MSLESILLVTLDKFKLIVIIQEKSIKNKKQSQNENSFIYALISTYEEQFCFEEIFVSQRWIKAILVECDALKDSKICFPCKLTLVMKSRKWKYLHNVGSFGFNKIMNDVFIHKDENCKFSILKASCKLLMRISEASKVETYIHKQVVSLIEMEMPFDFNIGKIMPSCGDFWTYVSSISNLDNHRKCILNGHTCCDHYETWRSQISIKKEHHEEDLKESSQGSNVPRIEEENPFQGSSVPRIEEERPSQVVIPKRNSRNMVESMWLTFQGKEEHISCGIHLILTSLMSINQFALVRSLHLKIGVKPY
ncbi:hypothetical protein O6H91_Y457900 [Diphasiastrum complanatum]|nr:hypothetical protein O6H91_Y457900 [Diphasiastrum complanatum]